MREYNSGGSWWESRVLAKTVIVGVYIVVDEWNWFHIFEVFKQAKWWHHHGTMPETMPVCAEAN